MLQIDSLTRRFGSQTVLDALSLDVPAGKVACLVGPSGCGKSTLLRLVAGLDRPDGGEIRVGERVISSTGWALEPHRRRLNMVFQDYALWPHMTVGQIVGYGLDRMSAQDRAARVSALLDLMQIGHLARRLPSQISGGQQQRVAIARALSTDPDMLLFDEPLSNLDVQLRLEMRREFAALFAEVGKTVLYVTHDPLEACSFADILVVMKAGTIEQMGAPETLFSSPQSAWIATLAGFESRVAGQVVGTTPDGRWRVRLAGQQIETVPAPGAAPDYAGPVSVMLRPDVLRSGGEAGTDTLTGRVLQSLFEGHAWRVALDIGGATLSFILPERQAPGQSLTLTLPRGAAIAFMP